MRHPIDPTVDCVFKALLGSEENRNLLVHFLNAILGADLPQPVVTVEILNPFNEREFLGDKLSVVDVKARDERQRQYQAEVQLLTHRDLPARMLYTWADLYGKQIKAGESFARLMPTFSIWLLGAVLLPDRPGYLHRFRLRDDAGLPLVEHGGIWVLELPKFAATEVHNEAERWLRFFREAPTLDETDLPDWMNTPQMRQAMSTLRAFSDKERAYDAYQARQNYLREQASIQEELADLRAEREAERAAKEAALAIAEAERQQKEAARAAEEAARGAEEHERQRADAALAEVERLQALLRARGGDGTTG